MNQQKEDKTSEQLVAATQDNKEVPSSSMDANYTRECFVIPQLCYPIHRQILMVRPTEPFHVITVDCSTNEDGSLKKMPLIPSVIIIQQAWRNWKTKTQTEFDYLYG